MVGTGTPFFSCLYDRCFITLYTYRFDECAISPLTLKALKAVGYEKMTVVQQATLPEILKGISLS